MALRLFDEGWNILISVDAFLDGCCLPGTLFPLVDCCVSNAGLASTPAAALKPWSCILPPLSNSFIIWGGTWWAEPREP